MRKTAAAVALLLGAAWIAGSGTARASMEMQKKAKEAGITVTGNCLYCHGEKLPKKGASTYNDRGKWLLEQKEKKGVKEIDVTWLKEYVEKK